MAVPGSGPVPGIRCSSKHPSRVQRRRSWKTLLAVAFAAFVVASLFALVSSRWRGRPHPSGSGWVTPWEAQALERNLHHLVSRDASALRTRGTGVPDTSFEYPSPLSEAKSAEKRKGGGSRPASKQAATLPAKKTTVATLPSWTPGRGKFLLAFCHFGRWSNRLHCVQRALLLSSLLNRTLIVPPLDVAASWQRAKPSGSMIDVAFLRRCLFQGTVLRPRCETAAVRNTSGTGTERSQASEQDQQAGEGRRQLSVPNRSNALSADTWFCRRQGVISLNEFLSGHHTQKVTVDMLLCDNSTGVRTSCPGRGVSLGNRVEFPTPAKPPLELYNEFRPLDAPGIRKLAESTAAAGVLCLGDTFYSVVKGFKIDGDRTLGPFFGSSCPLSFKPAPDIFRAAGEFIQEKFNGSRFAALHFRRTDFQQYCKKANCSFWSVPEAAECVSEQLAKTGISHLFLATDARYGERVQLGRLLEKKNISMVVLQPESGWNIPGNEYADWERKKVRAARWFLKEDVVEKVIAAEAEQFFYQDRSTFSLHIRQLRHGTGRASALDQRLCHSGTPDLRKL